MLEVDVQETHPCRRELSITVSPEAMEEELTTAYRDIGRASRVPGFRPGKAPRRVLEKHYGPDARARAVENRIREAVREALGKQDFRMLGGPEVSGVDWHPGGPLTFKAAVEVTPPIELKDYRGLKLTRRVVPVSGADVDRVIDDLRERKAEYPALEPRPARAGDWALVDYRPPGREGDDWVEGALIEISEDEAAGVGSQLLGLEPGGVREVTVPPGGGESPEADPPRFPVRLREIRERVLPEADDEWARGWGEYSGLEELRKQIRDDIAGSREIQARRDLEGQAVENLLQGYDFPLPPSVLENLTESNLRELRMLASRAPEGQETPPEAELADSARKKAERELRLLFVLREIARAEKIEVDGKVLGEEIGRLAARRGVDPARLRRELEEDDQVEVIRDRLIRDRALDLVIEQARIKEEKGERK